jgi:hypothetical protein
MRHAQTHLGGSTRDEGACDTRLATIEINEAQKNVRKTELTESRLEVVELSHLRARRRSRYFWDS